MDETAAMRKTLIVPGNTISGLNVQRAAVSGQHVAPAVPEAPPYANPSTSPAFNSPFTVPGYKAVTLTHVQQAVFVNPGGGNVNVDAWIDWSPTP